MGSLILLSTSVSVLITEETTLKNQISIPKKNGRFFLMPLKLWPNSTQNPLTSPKLFGITWTTSLICSVFTLCKTGSNSFYNKFVRLAAISKKKALPLTVTESGHDKVFPWVDSQEMPVYIYFMIQSKKLKFCFLQRLYMIFQWEGHTVSKWGYTRLSCRFSPSAVGCLLKKWNSGYSDILKLLISLFQ